MESNEKIGTYLEESVAIEEAVKTGAIVPYS